MKIAREIADAIELFIKENKFKRSEEEIKSILVAEHCGQDWAEFEDGQFLALNSISTYDLMKCVTNGYETEKTSKEKLKEQFENNKEMVEFYKNKSMDKYESTQDGYSRGYVSGVRDTLNAFELNMNIT